MSSICRTAAIACYLFFQTIVGAGTAAQAAEEGHPLAAVPLNHIQIIGSHNSYKKFIDPALEKILSVAASERIKTLHYDHESLSKQLDRGLRSLEIDVLYDPEGGRYANPAGLYLTRGSLSAQEKQVLSQPGYKVLHVQDIDFRSTCLTFALCLTELKKWSDAHPLHFPVFISMNVKQNEAVMPGGTDAIAFSAAAADALDEELRTHLGADYLLTPDGVRGAYASLREAVTTVGWPTVGAALGKFIFILDANKETRTVYEKGHKGLKGRAMFATFPETHEAGAIIFKNNPVRSAEDIRALTKTGFIVRTMADSATAEARTGDTGRRDSAFASSVQIISTDYYEGRNPFGTSYAVVFPNGAYVRKNPALGAN